MRSEAPKNTDKQLSAQHRIAALSILLLSTIGGNGCGKCDEIKAEPTPQPKPVEPYGIWTSGNMSSNELIAARHLQGRLGGEEPICKEAEAVFEQQFSKNPKAITAVQKARETFRQIVICATGEPPKIYIVPLTNQMGTGKIRGPFTDKKDRKRERKGKK